MASAKSTNPEKALRAFLSPFEERPGESGALSALTAVRRRALERFQALGLPTTQDEDWRFTNLAPLFRLPFRPAAHALTAFPDTLPTLTFGTMPGPRLVFVDGRFVPALSRIGALPPGLTVRPLSGLDAGDWSGLQSGLERDAGAGREPFAALNAAYFTDGGYIHAAPDAVGEEPIQLIFLSSGALAGTSSQVRNLIRAERGSRLTVLEVYASLGAAGQFTNTVTEIAAGDAARLEHLKFQDENADSIHLGLLFGEFGRSSQVRHHSFSLGSRLARSGIRAHLGGEGLECILNGLYLTCGEQLADHHMVVEHAQPHCASHEYFNGILDDRSRGVFHGRILVHPVAQKTDAKQTNKNILLSDLAQADTKPQLEIYADDVKCTHGATVGQLDEVAVFYLRSRGIGLERARRMLIHSFAGEIIQRVECGPVRDELDRLVWDRLEQNPHVAEARLSA